MKNKFGCNENAQRRKKGGNNFPPKTLTLLNCRLKNINVPVLIEGNLPKNVNECVVEKSFLESKNKKIGDLIEVKVENSTK